MADEHKKEMAELERRLRLRGRDALQRQIDKCIQLHPDFKRYGNIMNAYQKLVKEIKDHVTQQYEDREISEFMSRLDRLSNEVGQMRQEFGDE